LIGHKPSISYAFKIRKSVGLGNKEIVVKSRGKAIPIAVDTAELVKRLTNETHTVDTKVEIGTNTFTKYDKQINVSFMAITMIFTPIFGEA
jgi:DNA-binding protein Alba